MYFPSPNAQAQLVRRTVWAPAAQAVTSLDAVADTTSRPAPSADTMERRATPGGGDNGMFIAKWMPLILLLSLTGTIAAQQSQTQTPPAPDHQQDSLAAAAHRARQAKKDESKPAKVWDNDSLASSSGVISVVGQPAAPATSSAPAKSAAAGPPTPEKKSALEGDLNAAKATLQSLK